MKRAILALLPLLCACSGEAKDAVRRGMLDPDAAQFRDVQSCTADRSVWQGEVNGKNSYGAYVGYKSFFYADGSVAYAGEAGFMALMDRCFGSPKTEATSEPTASSSEVAPASVPKQEPSVSPKAAIDESDSEEEGPGRPNLAKQDRCWMDYCPCDTSNRDYGGADKFLCDRVRNGLPVGDELMSAASGAREGRRQIREFERDNGPLGQ